MKTGDTLKWASFGEESTYSSCATIDKIFTKDEGKFKRDQCNTKTCPVCYFSDWPSALKLRGICKKSNIDTFYYLMNNTMMIGPTRTKLIRNNERWEIRNKQEEILGIGDSKGLPLGTNPWSVFGCSQEETSLNLQAGVEEPGHFCCDDGACIDSSLVCDSRDHCEDGSDEARCDKVFLEDKYDKSIPPEVSENNPLRPKFFRSSINTKIEILDVADVDQTTGSFSVFMHLEMEWLDNKLKFAFLKEDYYENDINDTMKEKIWLPKYEFAFLENLETIFKRIVIKRENEPELSSDIDQLYSKGSINFTNLIFHFIFLIEIYKGSKNPIKAELFIRARFLCNFQSIDEDYPFGIDNCNFYIYLKDNQNGVVKLKLKQSLTDFGPSTVSAFRIVGWKAAEGHLAAKEYLKAISVEVTLKLRFFSIFMVTYLPTILMNVINQATNYITGGTTYNYINIFTSLQK